MKRDDLTKWLDELLQPAQFRDYCPNGLQVEGAPDVRRVVTGVSASLALFEAAIEADAQAVIVHHGLFWKNGWPLRVRGAMKKRLAALLRHDISLFGYHLPLDAHAEVGNNAQLAQRIGLVDRVPFGDYEGRSVGISGRFAEPLTATAAADRLAAVLGGRPLVLGDSDRTLRSLGIITGGAGYLFQQAIDAGLDAYLTGEPTEGTLHLAREEGAVFFAGGHYLTERFGVQALGDRIAEVHGIDVRFVELPNPV